MTKTLREHLKQIGACSPARKFAAGRTAQQAWDECKRPDWGLWWLVMEGQQQRVVMLICRLWRERVAGCVSADEARPLRAIEAAERWAQCPTEENRGAAAASALAASAAACGAYAAGLDAAADAADAAYAVCSGSAAGSAIAVADYAAAAADYAADARADARAARRRAEKAVWCAAIREEFQCPWQECAE